MRSLESIEALVRRFVGSRRSMRGGKHTENEGIMGVSAAARGRRRRRRAEAVRSEAHFVSLPSPPRRDSHGPDTPHHPDLMHVGAVGFRAIRSVAEPLLLLPSALEFSHQPRRAERERRGRGPRGLKGKSAPAAAGSASDRREPPKRLRTDSPDWVAAVGWAQLAKFPRARRP